MTVSELIAKLLDLPGEAPIALSTRYGEADDFTVEKADDGWIVFDG